MSWQAVGWTLGGSVAGFAVLRAMPFAKVVLWSPMRGRVLLNGAPAAGAVLVRSYHWHWADRKGTDRTVADADGRFAFPAIHGRMVLGLVLPHEPVTRQEMSVEHLGVSYFAWYHFNHDYLLDAENGGRPIVVACRLDEQPHKHGDLYGLCDFE